MSGKKMTVGFFVVVIAVIVLYVLFRFSSDPGGPIIVIRPAAEPAPTPLGIKQCISPPCWYAGWLDSRHWDNLPNLANDIGDAEPPKIPYFWNHVAGVREMHVTSKSGDITYASKLELMIGEKRLVIEIANSGAVPKWKFGKDILSGKFLRSRRSWPHALLGEITDVKVTDREHPGVESRFSFDDLKEIQISYNQ